MVYEIWQRLKKREDGLRPECKPHYPAWRLPMIDVRPRASACR